MALTPQNSEAFLREVDDELRRDQAVRLWKRWGRVAIGAIIVGLIALAGFLWWRSSQEAAAGVEGEKLAMVLNDVASGSGNVDAELKTIEGSKTPGYNAAARFMRADVLLGKGDIKGAAGLYGAIAADAALPKPYRDAALIRQTSAEFDTLKPEVVIERLKPLAVKDQPWFGSAGEMTGIAYMRLNRKKDAGEMFAAIARDEGVPESLRSRSVQLAGLMGVEATPVAKSRN